MVLCDWLLSLKQWWIFNVIFFGWRDICLVCKALFLGMSVKVFPETLTFELVDSSRKICSKYHSVCWRSKSKKKVRKDGFSLCTQQQGHPVCPALGYQNFRFSNLKGPASLTPTSRFKTKSYTVSFHDILAFETSTILFTFLISIVPSLLTAIQISSEIL
jgi:hypothetical protein